VEHHKEQAEEEAHHLRPHPEGEDQEALSAKHLPRVPEEAVRQHAQEVAAGFWS
jgi:hypothetical protein